MSSSENKNPPRVSQEFVHAIYAKEQMARTASGRYVDLHDVQGWNDPSVSRQVFAPAVKQGEEDSFTISMT